MKKIIVLLIVAALLFSAALVILNWNEIKLKFVLDRYNRILNRELPQDFTLKIYWMSPYIDTYMSVTVESIKTDYEEHTRTIVVTSKEMAKHLEALKQLNSSVIQTTDAFHRDDRRLYYVFETEGKSILDVSLFPGGGTDEGVNAYICGIKVKPNPALYEAIIPFLSEEDRKFLHLYEIGIISKDK